MKLIYGSILLAIFASCASTAPKNMDYRQEMRDFVIEISTFSKSQNPNFIVIPQNGHELVLKEDGKLANDYLSAIDGLGQEDLNFGYIGDNVPTPEENRNYILQQLLAGQKKGKTVLVTDYAEGNKNYNTSETLNSKRGFISYVAEERDLTIIPEQKNKLKHNNSNDIENLKKAQNFLYLLNFEQFETKEELLNSLQETNYDIFILDAFYHSKLFTPQDLEKIRYKKSGGKRLLISYMSIGEAEDYRFYWNSDWDASNINWIDAENPKWKGNYKVKYWNKDWKRIITGTSSSYLQRIIDAGFDGVYLDIIDAFWYFENKKDL